MRSKSFFSGKFPLLTWGKVSFSDGMNLAVKSYRSLLFFIVFWSLAKLRQIIKTKTQARELSLFIEELQGLVSNLKGFLVYRPRDPRGRQYGILYGKTKNYFIKVGKDISFEEICDSIKFELVSNGFYPVVPEKKVYLADCVSINFYQFYSYSHWSKTRLSLEEAQRFTNSLNKKIGTRSTTLGQYLAEKEFDEGTSEFLKDKRVKGIVEKLLAQSFDLGTVHGDLMSPNILRSRKTNEFLILDWESLNKEEPLLLDTFGAQDWKVAFASLKTTFGTLESGEIGELKRESIDWVLFAIVAGLHGFKPAIEVFNEKNIS